jgi:hypothetical protein
MEKPVTQPVALTFREFLAAVRISRATFYQIPVDQRPKARLIGNKMLIPVDEAKRFVESLPLATYDQMRGVNKKRDKRTASSPRA